MTCLVIFGLMFGWDGLFYRVLLGTFKREISGNISWIIFFSRLFRRRPANMINQADIWMILDDLPAYNISYSNIIHNMRSPHVQTETYYHKYHWPYCLLQ